MGIGQTILEQLGGHRFQTMTGARDFVSGNNLLSFRVPKANQGINHVCIRLDTTDTYTVTFSRLRNSDVTAVATVSSVYVETLRQVFTDHTGLQCSL